MAKNSPKVIGDFPETGKVPSDTISRLLNNSKYNKQSIESVNHGRCDEFAEDFATIVGGKVLELGLSSSYPTHIWNFVSNKHYDCETPQGVSDWKDLAIFK
jgi:hypothetical protein